MCDAVSNQADLEGGRFQFTLGTLLAVMAAVAVTCSLFFRIPVGVAMPLMALITMALPATLTIIVIYGRGWGRVFSIGALFPAATMMLCTSLMLFVHSISAYQNSVKEWTTFAEKVGPYYRIYIGGTWAMCLVVGLLTLVVHWVVLRKTRRA